MQKIFLILIAFTGIVAVSSCSKEEPAPAPALLVDIPNIPAMAEAGVYSIKITSNSAWTAESSETWCLLDKTSGSGSDTVTLSVDENTAFMESR
ncbi:MAG: BACON domain-containing protein, partial [Prevotellaceae bacterium]|nr:BACON domain-containing protein [Prevotellaceae bacterium]